MLLADSQGLVRAGFRLLRDATERISAVGEAAGGEEPVAVAPRLRPDVAQAVQLLGSPQALTSARKHRDGECRRADS